MKKIYTSIATLFIVLATFGQVPEKMSYQAVIRDSANELVANTEVGMQISILQGSILEVVYQETQTPTTNANGLVSLEIGTGTTSDYFSFINWAIGPYFIKTETDPTGGTNYTITSTSQLMSVPYALYAKESGSSTSPNLQTVLAENNSANNQQIKNLQDPNDDQDAVTKAYTYSKAEVQAMVSDLQAKLYGYPRGSVFCDGVVTKVVEVTNPETGKTWMDRNLGASRAATSSTDGVAYGNLYQWGRGADGHQCRDSQTNYNVSSIDQPGHGEFILTSNAPYDWRNSQNDNLWQSADDVNNPCPSGYRLPTEAELDAELQSWVTDDAAGAINSPLKLPMGGLRNHILGSFFNVSTIGLYWSSTVSSSNSRHLSFNSSSDAGMSSSFRANGFSVRCIKE